MKILMFADTGSVYVLNFLRWVTEKRPNYLIDVITPREKNLDIQNVREITFLRDSLLAKIPKLRGLIRLKQKRNYILQNESYDVCHIHFVSPYLSFLTNTFAKKCSYLICSIWGSDFYRASDRQRRIQTKLYENSSVITSNNEYSALDFDHYYQVKYSEKLRICRFGLAPLEVLRKLELNKMGCRKHLGLPEDSIIVTVGYNNSPGQQHIEILKSIKKRRKEIPENLFFILPMTYGATNEYRNTVRKYVEQHSLRYKIFDRFMPDEEMAMLRRASDIMIQVQITDQFSGSMQEHLYSENVVITGDWLPYGTLDEKGIFMLKVSSVEEVGEKLVYALNNLDSLKEKCKKNPEIIWELSSWEKNIQSWIDMYEELLHRGR